MSDCLSAIISAFEDTGKAIINDSVTTGGYYLIDGKLIANDTNQLPISSPDLMQSKDDAKRRMLDCISVLEELNKRWKKSVFSTVIKWSIISPFSYILKRYNKWIPSLFLYGWSKAGKTTLGIVVLSMWRKYTPKTKDEYMLGFGSISSEARFGNVVSRDTYPRLINEVGSLSDPKYGYLLEIMKNAVENLTARGRIENYRNYVTIPALSPLILTSNHNPPQNDTGYKRRILGLFFDKNDAHQEKDAKEFGKWFEEKRDFLGTLGDYVAAYLKEHYQELLQLISKGDADWEEISKIILQSFYKSASKEAPEWVNDDIIEQNTLEESKEDATVELRAFLVNEINEYYNKYVKTIETYGNGEATRQDIGNTKLMDRIVFCIDYKIIPYIYEYKSKQLKVNLLLM